MAFSIGSLKKYIVPVQIMMILVWLSLLAGTDANFSIYVLLAFASLWLLLRHGDRGVKADAGSPLLPAVVSVVLSGAVLLANYPLFTHLEDPALMARSTSILMNLINAGLTFGGGICLFLPILRFVFDRFPVCVPAATPCGKKYMPLLIFASFAVIGLVHLFLVEYPGNISEDPFAQVEEMLSGQYSSFNTFWHTMLFQGSLKIGYALSGGFPGALAFTCTVQMLLMAAAFTYCLMTMSRCGAPRWLLIGAWAVYALIPYNIAMPITMWKDVPYAAAFLLLICSWLRILKGEKGIASWIVFVLASILFFLVRSNGWLIYLVTFLIVCIPLRKEKRLLLLMGAMALLGWVLLNPVQSALGVAEGDVVESLSIPIQQVSRVIVEGCPLTEEEEALLSRVVDLERVPARYCEWLSDPMKVDLRSKDYDFFLQNMDQYRDLWIRLGLRYPVQYLKAWVDQTKGYWNGGYDYFLYAEAITENPYGLVKSGGGNIIGTLFRLYFGLSRHLIFFEPLHAIGLHIWAFAVFFLLNLKRKRQVWVVMVPLALLILGLWFGTPVYCSFRYVYPLFVSMPLLLTVSLFRTQE